jgi:hypothetical protein
VAFVAATAGVLPGRGTIVPVPTETASLDGGWRHLLEYVLSHGREKAKTSGQEERTENDYKVRACHVENLTSDSMRVRQDRHGTDGAKHGEDPENKAAG